MQVLGRDTGVLQLSYALHPLVSASGLLLGSLRDGSFLASPGLSYSASESLSLRPTLRIGETGSSREWGSIPTRSTDGTDG